MKTPHLSRTEDARLLTGQAQYVCNIPSANALHAVFVRSPHAQATVRSIDTATALATEGVVAVLTEQDFAGLPQPQINTALCPVQPLNSTLISSVVQSVGAPVALVLAHTQQAAQLGADALWVDYHTSGVTVNNDFAQGQSPQAQLHQHIGQCPSHAATASVSIQLPRVAASPLEPRAALMRWDQVTQTLTAHLSTQTPSRAQVELAAALGIPTAQVRVIATDVGGAFGAKASIFPEDLLLAHAAKRLQTTLRWQSRRSEDLLSGVHGRCAQLSAQVWANPAGQLQALQANVQFSLGSWLTYSTAVPMRNALRILPGPYRVPILDVQGKATMSNAAAVGIYRGAGRPEAVILMERAVDATARALGIDPFALRLANVWASADLPRDMPNGAHQDTADFAALLHHAAQLFNYTTRRAAQQRWQGIGMALYTEPCGSGGESVRLTAHANGTYTLATGSTAQGQGRETAYAAIAAQALQCQTMQITVVHGDTAVCPAGVGALASRSTAIGGSAILQAVAQLQTDLAQGKALPHTVEVFHTVAHEAWASGCVMVAVNVDPDTGQLSIEQLVWVDDAGHVVDTDLVHGQLIGGLAQGLGQALMEQLVYDEQGQLITGSLMDYALPRASDMPAVQLASLNTRSAANTLGAKGVGEAGCIGVPAALLNAAYDALRHIPNVQLDYPLRAEQLWRVSQNTECLT